MLHAAGETANIELVLHKKIILWIVFSAVFGYIGFMLHLSARLLTRPVSTARQFYLRKW